MKKPVILALIAMYVLSIVVVGYMGGAFKLYNPVQYVESIVCENEEAVSVIYKNLHTREIEYSVFVVIKVVLLVFVGVDVSKAISVSVSEIAFLIAREDIDRASDALG